MSAWTAEQTARDIGGQMLVDFFDLILIEQRKRWNAPDWREREPIAADVTNWHDVAAALREITSPRRAYIASGQPGEAD